MPKPTEDAVPFEKVRRDEIATAEILYALADQLAAHGGTRAAPPQDRPDAPPPADRDAEG